MISSVENERCSLPDDRRRAVRVMHDLLRGRADQPSAEQRLAAMTQHNMIDAVRLGVMDDLLRRVPDGDREAGIDARLGGSRLQRAELPLIIFPGALDHR